ncbi:uncharacterized protein H6S33_004510 [Morchella sextelata]|uniref:uncharacterized protein n=1 Tax=Morchella sextelata TaxID=1174677 RepID=UPI001D0534EE|nr:uncharacterized protein H6S33_004510 [Morchella sextelata]KAH0606053.1 hypothetical protein H6S33_004510 [Morchella sextelata]
MSTPTQPPPPAAPEPATSTLSPQPPSRRRSPFTPAPPIESPPPVYTPSPPTIPFVVVEDPPPYSPKQDCHDTRAKRGEGRVCGVKTVHLVAILALLVAVGVIAGGVYGYQHRGSSSNSSTDTTDTFVVPDMSGPGVYSVDGLGNMDQYVGTVGGR